MSATVATVNASIGRDRPGRVKFVIGPDTALLKKLVVPVGGHCPFTSTALDSPAISRLSDPGSTENLPRDVAQIDRQTMYVKCSMRRGRSPASRRSLDWTTPIF